MAFQRTGRALAPTDDGQQVLRTTRGDLIQNASNALCNKKKLEESDRVRIRLVLKRKKNSCMDRTMKPNTVYGHHWARKSSGQPKTNFSILPREESSSWHQSSWQRTLKNMIISEELKKKTRKKSQPFNLEVEYKANTLTNTVKPKLPITQYGSC